MSVTHALPQPVPLVVDTVAGVGILASLVHALPPIAAILAILWYAIQIYESDTMRALLHRPRSAFRRQGTLHHNHRPHHAHPPEIDHGDI